MGSCNILISLCLLYCSDLSVVRNYNERLSGCKQWDLVVDTQPQRGITWRSVNTRFVTIQVYWGYCPQGEKAPCRLTRKGYDDSVRPTPIDHLDTDALPQKEQTTTPTSHIVLTRVTTTSRHTSYDGEEGTTHIDISTTTSQQFTTSKTNDVSAPQASNLLSWSVSSMPPWIVLTIGMVVVGLVLFFARKFFRRRRLGGGEGRDTPMSNRVGRAVLRRAEKTLLDKASEMKNRKDVKNPIATSVQNIVGGVLMSAVNETSIFHDDQNVYEDVDNGCSDSERGACGGDLFTGQASDNTGTSYDSYASASEGDMTIKQADVARQYKVGEGGDIGKVDDGIVFQKNIKKEMKNKITKHQGKESFYRNVLDKPAILPVFTFDNMSPPLSTTPMSLQPVACSTPEKAKVVYEIVHDMSPTKTLTLTGKKTQKDVKRKRSLSKIPALVTDGGRKGCRDRKSPKRLDL